MLKYLFILIVFPTIVFGEIENARDLMEKGEFDKERELFKQKQ